IPSNKPTPPLPWNQKIADGYLAVRLGGNFALESKFPHTIFSMAEEPMLVIDWEKDTGNLIITTLRVFDDRDDIIARIDNDGFWVQNTIRKKRPDQHTLVVYDHNDDEVLRIEFLNPKIVSIAGIFRHRKLKPKYMIAEQDQLRYMPRGPIVSGNLSKDSEGNSFAF